MGLALLRVVGGAAIVAFLVAGFTPAVNLLSYWMAPARRAEPTQAIVVLGAGGVDTSGGLTETSLHAAMDAITLYRQGLAPVVVFSGFPRDGAKGEAQLRADLAVSCGIPGPAMLTTSRARTTNEEAHEIRTLLEPRGIRKIMLVADSAGMRRAMGVFERAGFDVVPTPWVGTLDLGGSPEARINLLRRVVIELGARLYYRMAGHL